MMTPAALYDKLVANAPLLALVDVRIFPTEAEQDTLAPFIIWQRIGGDPLQTHGEAATNQFVLVQFSCWGADFDEAEGVQLALTAALDNQALSTGDNPTLQGMRDMGRDPVTKLYRMDVDFLI